MEYAIFLIYLLWSLVNLAIAGERGRNIYLTFAASLFATPFLIYLYLVAVPAKPHQ